MKPGTRLAEYEIVAPLGAGGMGEVYRARDPRLGREVAIKVLPADLADSSEALARFETEARAVAALSHPNILEIYDVGREGSVSYVVAELLDGETLSELLADGTPPTGKAVEYARQLASALAAAHAKGIVHRDVKPANIFVTVDGRVKLLDFGLAKSTSLLQGSAESVETLAVSTEPGTVLGTVGYMAPEQVRGEEASPQSDIFALGAVLFELLTGKAPFQRPTHAETMTAILREDPPALADLPKPLPGTLEAIVLHCLEKRSQERFQTAQDLAFALQSVGGGADSASTPRAGTLPAPARRSRFGPAAALALVLALASGAVLGRWLGPSETAPSAPPRLVQFTFSARDFDPSASPDGNLIVFASGRDGRSRIWLKQRTGAGAAPLTEGEDSAPRFSPDGQSILFTRVDAQRRPTLQRIALVRVQQRHRVDDDAMGDWSSDGKLAFVRPDPQRGDRLMLADADGLNERELLFAPELRLADPRFSPSGDRIAVTRYTSSAGRHRAVIVDVATGESRELPTATATDRVSAAAWNRSGSALIYSITGSSSGDRGVLPSRVLRHDLATDERRTLLWTTGLFPQQGDAYEVPGFDVLGNDNLVFYAVSAPSSLYELDLEQATVGQMGRRITYGDGRDRQPAYSPDGERVVFTSNRSGNLDLWIYDRGSGTIAQITDDPADDWDPAWGPDGSLVWSSSRSGLLEIWMADADGSNARQVTDKRSDAQNPTMTADGEWVVFATRDASDPGIIRIRPDGSDETLVNLGAGVLPEVSPSGALVASPIPAGFGGQVRIQFARVDPPEVLDAVIQVETNPLALDITMGRPRWIREDLLAFIASDEEGQTGVVSQRVELGRDTADTRRKLAGFYPDGQIETFGLSPDRRWIMLGVQLSARRIMIVEDVPGLE